MQKHNTAAIAESVVREVVNCIADRRYGDITNFAQLDVLSPADLEELLDVHVM